MIRTIYNAVGTLTNVLSETDNILTVDSTLHNLISMALGVGDWAYLAVDDGYNVEIVKVYRSNSVGEYVVRARDNTKARRFSVGAVVRYELTAQEIVDSFPIPPLLVFPYGAMRLDGSVLRYRMPDIQDVGGTYSVVSQNEIVLDRNIGIEGCCDVNDKGAPSLPSPYIYFTSHIYPLEVDEAVIVSARLQSGRLQSAVLSEEDTLVSARLLSGVLVLSLVSHTQPPEDALEVSSSFLSGDLVIALVIQDQPVEDALEVSAVLQEGELKLVNIIHAQPPEDALEVSVILQSGTLE